jgi:hypothetical protein
MKRQNVETSKSLIGTARANSRCPMAGGVLCLILLAGCAHINNPYEDSSAMIDEELTTTSTQGYMAEAKSTGRPPGRTWSGSSVHYTNGSVTHWPLWFEDPFEDKGNGYRPVADRDAPDNVFCWNWVDYLHMGYGPARELLNIGGFPASAIITPPGTLMVSDGHIDKDWSGYNFDDTRADSATREPPHVHAVDRQPSTDQAHKAPPTGTQPEGH